MSYFWSPSPNYDPGRPGPIRWIVWHDTEGNETNSAAINVARNWFGIRASGVSAHVVVDALDVAECVRPQDRAWHVGPFGNPYGYGIEIVGHAAQSVTDWVDPFSKAALQKACQWVLSVPVLAAIPRRFLTDTELASGASGHITHAQVSRVLGGTQHTDPGPNFPFALVAQYLNEGDTSVQWTDKAIPDYSQNPPTMLGADVTIGWAALHAEKAAELAELAVVKTDAAIAKLDAILAKLA